MTPEICPNCGADVPPKAKACPECGADEETGWSEEAVIGSLNLSEDKFDYDEYVKREFGGAAPKRRLEWLWITVAIVLLVALFFWIVPFGLGATILKWMGRS